MATRFAWDISDDSAPGSDIIPITPDDDNDITSTAGNGDTIVGVRAIRADSAGVISVKMASGQNRDLSFAAGETRVGFFLRVRETGTTVELDTQGDGIEGHV